MRHKLISLTCGQRSTYPARIHIATIHFSLGDLHLLSIHHGANGPKFPATPQRTARSHEAVDYDKQFQGLAGHAVKDRVVPLLLAMEREETTSGKRKTMRR